MDTIEKFTCFFPELSEELKDTPYLKTNLGRKKIALEKAQRLLALLYVGRDGGGGYVQLSAKQMAKDFGGNNSWQRIVEALEAADWIERKHRYRVGTGDSRAICKGYRLSKKALSSEWKSKKEVRPKEIKCRQDNRPELDGVTLDKESAIAHLETLDLTAQTKAKATISIERFNAKFSRGVTGRLFTHSNGLKKELRPFVKINGNAVAEIDVKNCHPLLMATLYPSESEEAGRFRQLVESGGFYADIARFRNLPFTGKFKDRVKKGFTALLGGGKNPPTYHYFRTEWPELFQVFMEMNAANKKAVCFHLQRLESKIIVDEFAARFGRQCVSIHDGLLVEAFARAEAEALLIEIFQEWHGLTPTIH